MTAEKETSVDMISRIEALEVTLAYQSQTLEDLNRTITEQWRLIDQLTRGLTQLVDRVQAAEERASLASAPSEPPPPHY